MKLFPSSIVFATLISCVVQVFIAPVGYVDQCSACQSTAVSTSAAKDFKPIPRRIPPQGIKVEKAEIEKLQRRIKKLQSQPNAANPDVALFLKAVEYAVIHGEFYKPYHVKMANRLLGKAQQRLEMLKENKVPWKTDKGLVVRGYRSAVDDSVQPYGLVIPENIDLQKPVPLYVWLHGRGDAKTDMHFVDTRMTKKGQISPSNAIVLHPFGRHCIGFKSAGEVDVIEAIADVCSQYKIDPSRIVLMGFSMGGAGVWHIGSHYTDRFVAMSPGAGFSETAQYNRLTPEKFPPLYEQKLWGIYDCPGYVRNLFNLPVVAYSGEKDKQIQAARVMESAFAKENKTLRHIIGPEMGHKYDPASLKKILELMDQATQAKQKPWMQRDQILLQTQTLRYGQLGWVKTLGLKEHWSDTRIDARRESPELIQVETKNVSMFEVTPPNMNERFSALVDGQSLSFQKDGLKSKSIRFQIMDGQWKAMESDSSDQLGTLKSLLGKKLPGLQGPIDDAFMSRFLVVRPTGEFQNARAKAWAEFELGHLQQRWRALFRGDLPIKNDVDVTPQDAKESNLILFGDPSSNSWIRKILDQLPMQWDRTTLNVNSVNYDSKHHIPMMIRRNPVSPSRYVVINSGPTFRENHDRTNSLQNPKLPDWAVIDIRQAPSGEAAGKVIAADFFDESWNFKK